LHRKLRILPLVREGVLLEEESNCQTKKLKIGEKARGNKNTLIMGNGGVFSGG
jgi:hypothetical protein